MSQTECIVMANWIAYQLVHCGMSMDEGARLITDRLQTGLMRPTEANYTQRLIHDLLQTVN